MKSLRLVNILLVVLSPLFALGQSYNSARDRSIRPIKTENPEQEGKIHITYRGIDSRGNIDVFLENRSKENLKIVSYGFPLEFTREAKNDRGEWVVLRNPIMRRCGNEPKNIFDLPPNFYTWQTISASDYEGDFETELRFSYYVNTIKKTVYTRPTSTKVNHKLFTPPSQFSISDINYILTQDEITDKEVKEYTFQKAELYAYERKYVEAIEIFNSLLNKYPDFDEARYSYALTLYSIVKTMDLPEVDRYGMISKAIIELEKIPDSSPKYEAAQSSIKDFNWFLPTLKVLKAVKKGQCQQIDNSYHCLIESYLNETVQIKLR